MGFPIDRQVVETDGPPPAIRSLPDVPGLHAVLRVLVDFHTWRILTSSGMDHGEAVELAAAMVTGVVG